MGKQSIKLEQLIDLLFSLRISIIKKIKIYEYD